MNKNQTIDYIPYDKLDVKKWDTCIDNAVNGIIYAYSWYLDIVAEKWDALVMGDYEYVMPLIPRRKFGISYLYQPYFTQQSGIFSSNLLNAEVVNKFLLAIPSRYRLVEISLNTFNTHNRLARFETERRATYQLDLIQPYQQLCAAYKINTIRNIRKAQRNNLFIDENIDMGLFMRFTREHLQKKVPELKNADFLRLQKLASYCIRYGRGRISAIYSDHNELLATAFFVWSHHKPILLVSASSDEGKRQSAMFMMIDQFIQKYAGSPYTLDFEGSTIESVARFYAGFGATPTEYSFIRRNRLPLFLKWFKQ
jgi:hypothetical protein